MSYIRIKKHYVHLPYLVLGGIEALLLAIVYLGILSIVDPFLEIPLGALPIALGTLAFVIVMVSCSMAMGVYQALAREDFASLILRTLVSFTLLASPLLYFISFVFNDSLIPRVTVLWSVLISVAVVVLMRAVFLWLSDSTGVKRRVLLYGAGQRAQKLIDDLAPHNDAIGVKIIACVANADEVVQVKGLPVWEEPTDWLALVKTEAISEIVIVPDDRRRANSHAKTFEHLLDCKLAGVDSSEALEFSERELGFVDVTVLRPAWMLFSDGFRYAPIGNAAKRMVDILLAMAFLLVMWPIMLITAIAVKLDSRGPALYSQIRIGLNGQPFKIHKFRSMRINAEQNGAVWASKNDARVTRVGGFIRNTRLDELPQLLNVLRGEMSFIGPRPERPEFVSKLCAEIPYYDLRHRVKPGLMGWAQLNYPYGWSVEDAKNKLQYDLYYVKNNSFFMDILILIQTVEVILLGKGAQ